MAELKRKGMETESPQAAKDGISTTVFGGDAPDHRDVVKSVNARAQKRHEMKGDMVSDYNVLPESSKMVNNEMVGVKDNGYLVKKGLQFGVNAFYNSLPPGTDIEDQENSDIRKMEMHEYKGGIGYPGDGFV